jgi:hypothetical protein
MAGSANMPRLSSRTTFFYKRVFPVVWFGILLMVLAGGLYGSSRNATPLPFFIVPAFMAVVGFVIMKKLIFDLVDEVLDAGDALIVRNGNREDRIALSDIMNVNYSPMVNPPRVTLSLRRLSAFGEAVTFCAPVRFVPFSTSPMIDDLIRRVDAARRC